MFKYKYLLTMLAMVFFNLAVMYYFNDYNLSVFYLFAGSALLLLKACIVKVSGSCTKEQLKQWLVELSLLMALAGWSLLPMHLLHGVIFIVVSIVGLLMFVWLALYDEMSKLDDD